MKLIDKRTRIFFLGVILLLVNNCSTSTHFEGNLREYVHQNGLTIKLPEEYAAAKISDGFTVEPADESNKNRRDPIRATIHLRGIGEIPADDNAEQKAIGNRTIKYRIEKKEGGSGGAEYNFSGYETIKGELISYAQSEQSESSPPRFDLIWLIIANTSVKN
jgi:hypothetical protein